jgi:hypothetical protein
MKYVTITVQATVKLPEYTDLNDLMLDADLHVRAYSNGGCKIVRIAGVEKTDCKWVRKELQTV